jgi:Ca-activated chloride channel family protein
VNDGLFDYPWVLLLLLLVPAIGTLLHLRRAERSGPMLFSRVGLFRARHKGPKAYLVPVTHGTRLLAMALLIVACARPSLKTVEESSVEGIDIYVCLDLSGSMQSIDVTDAELRSYMQRGVEPPSRFEIARDVLANFVRSRKVDRIGLVVFAFDAFLQFPLTLDYSTILTQLDNLNIGDIDGSGTAIGNALGRAVSGLKSSDAESKIVILITDGDRRGGNISPMQAADFAKELGVNVFPILVGKEGQTRIPAGKNLLTGQTTYRLHEYPVNPKLLQEIADKTGGKFYRATDKTALEENLHKILDTYEKSQQDDVKNVSRTELFAPFAVLAILLLVFEVLLSTVVIRPFP